MENEIMVNEEVVTEATEVVTTKGGIGKAIVSVAIVGGVVALAAKGVKLLTKHVIAPAAAKIRAKKEKPQVQIATDDDEEYEYSPIFSDDGEAIEK